MQCGLTLLYEPAILVVASWLQLAAMFCVSKRFGN